MNNDLLFEESLRLWEQIVRPNIRNATGIGIIRYLGKNSGKYVPFHEVKTSMDISTTHKVLRQMTMTKLADSDGRGNYRLSTVGLIIYNFLLKFEEFYRDEYLPFLKKEVEDRERILRSFKSQS